jgi:3'-5' exoribonuclease
MRVGKRKDDALAKQLIEEMKEGDIVSTYLQVGEGQLFNFRNKTGKYALFTFSDRSGSIKGVCWERGEKYYDQTADGEVVYVVGKIVVYNGIFQITVESVAAAGATDYDPADFLASTTLDVDALFEYMLKRIDGIKNKYLKQLLESFFKDPDFAAIFKRAPAAKSIHHSYLGGLVEHTSNCLKLAVTLCEIYPQLDHDLLCTGVMIHDIGKTVELSYDQKLDYTDRGRLLGHIVLGQNMVLDNIRKIPNFPDHLSVELLHLIVSHHGENSTGSPKRPKMAEACALHFLENLDAQTKRFIQIIEDVSHKKKDDSWTSYDRLLERHIYFRPVDEEE